MYKIKNTVYAEPGHMIRDSFRLGFQLPGELSDFTEVPVTIDDMTYEDGLIMANNNHFRWRFSKATTYAEAKKRIIAARYSNDDQIAIMLNREDDPVSYKRMQEWREWASTVAHKIMELLTTNEQDN